MVPAENTGIHALPDSPRTEPFSVQEAAQAESTSAHEPALRSDTTTLQTQPGRITPCIRNLPKCSAFNRFLLYENKTRFLIITSNASDSRHRIIKIDRTSQDSLDVIEDGTDYSGKQMSDLIEMWDNGNKASGGIGKPRAIYGVVGTVPQCQPNVLCLHDDQVSSDLQRAGIWSSFQSVHTLHCLVDTTFTIAKAPKPSLFASTRRLTNRPKNNVY